MDISEPLDDTTPVLPDLKPDSGPARVNKRSFATARVILALMLREMTTKYGRSPGGYIWAILEPAGAIALLSFAFSLMMRTPSLGNSFIVFYASGYMAFSHYNTLEKSVNNALPYAAGLLRYPVVTWLDAILARFFINALTNVLNAIVIIWGALYFSGESMMVDFWPMVEAMAAGSVLALGMGTLDAFLLGMSPLYRSIYKIITRPLMIMSAVLFIVEDLPSTIQDIIWYNPLVHITGLMRAGVYATYDPQYISLPYVFTIAMVSLTIGLFFLRSYARSIVHDK